MTPESRSPIHPMSMGCPVPITAHPRRRTTHNPCHSPYIAATDQSSSSSASAEVSAEMACGPGYRYQVAGWGRTPVAARRRRNVRALGAAGRQVIRAYIGAELERWRARWSPFSLTAGAHRGMNNVANFDM